MSDANAILARIREALSGGDNRPEGEGWITVRECSKAWGIGECQTAAILCKAFRAGLMEREKGKVGGRLVMFYREKQAETVCPKCNSSTQVWVNQITGKLTCHRVGCHIAIDKEKQNEPSRVRPVKNPSRKSQA